MTGSEKSGRRDILIAVIGATALILAAVIGAIITTSGDGDGDGDGKVVVRGEVRSQPEGSITAPQSGDEVSPAFTAEGTLSGIPDGRHVWLATQIDNLLFPKEPQVPADDQRWIQQVVEGGNPPGGAFALVLLMVDASGQEEIKQWLERGQRGDGFGGLAKISGSSRLAVVRDVVLR